MLNGITVSSIWFLALVPMSLGIFVLISRYYMSRRYAIQSNFSTRVVSTLLLYFLTSGFGILLIFVPAQNVVLRIIGGFLFISWIYLAYLGWRYAWAAKPTSNQGTKWSKGPSKKARRGKMQARHMESWVKTGMLVTTVLVLLALGVVMV